MTTVAVTTSTTAAARRAAAASVNEEGSNFLTGQMINIKVQQRLDEQHYVVVMRGETRKVTSERPLPVGETIDTVVVHAAANKLELRQVSPSASSVSDSLTEATGLDGNAADYSDISRMARFYKCNFSPAELAALQVAVNNAPQADQMTLAGLFVNKRGLRLESGLLNALYMLQSESGVLPNSSGNADASVLTDNVPMTVADLAQVMRQVLAHGEPAVSAINKLAPEDDRLDVDAATTSDLRFQSESVALSLDQSASQDSTGDNSQRQALFQLLSDVDAEGMGVRYGTLPVLINGRLVELELVMYQHRQQATDVEPLRRLVMSINTNTLGAVQITAEALNNRLMIKISGDTAEQTETLASYADEVSELVTRFGWVLDSIGYEVRTAGGRLAQRVMEHSVRQGVIDHVW